MCVFVSVCVNIHTCMRVCTNGDEIVVGHCSPTSANDSAEIIGCRHPWQTQTEPNISGSTPVMHHTSANGYTSKKWSEMVLSEASWWCTWHTHALVHAVGSPCVPHVLRGRGIVWTWRRAGCWARVPAERSTASAMHVAAILLLLSKAMRPTHRKKGFLRSRRLLDLEPVWSTWATILMS